MSETRPKPADQVDLSELSYRDRSLLVGRPGSKPMSAAGLRVRRALASKPVGYVADNLSWTVFFTAWLVLMLTGHGAFGFPFFTAWLVLMLTDTDDKVADLAEDNREFVRHVDAAALSQRRDETSRRTKAVKLRERYYRIAEEAAEPGARSNDDLARALIAGEDQVRLLDEPDADLDAALASIVQLERTWDLAARGRDLNRTS